ncbi:MAG TPA: 50S ribosomal protein L30 [Thermoplasmata archaeon]|jgi:large subunit ribosomal protein L30|nr:50S ribosomal protein L30 [Thermoplasmata archaeon]
MTYAVVRVRGHVNVNGQIRETLGYLRLNRTNHCVLLPKNATVEGMLHRAKDYVTWGEVDATVAAQLLVRRGRLAGNRPIDDAYVKANSKFPSLNSFAKALATDQATLGDVKGLKPVIRLHPARGGLGGIKQSVRAGGALGYRGAEINALLQRMLGPEES